METRYQIFKITDTDVLIPSTDYYARSGDSSRDTIQTLSFIESFKDENDAKTYIEDMIGMKI